MAAVALLMCFVSLLLTECISRPVSKTCCNDMQLYYEPAAICGQLLGLPTPNIPKLEAACKELIKRWQEAGMLTHKIGGWLT